MLGITSLPARHRWIIAAIVTLLIGSSLPSHAQTPSLDGHPTLVTVPTDTGVRVIFSTPPSAREKQPPALQLSAPGDEHWRANHFAGGGVGLGSVMTIEVLGNDVYVGGRFDSIGGIAARNVARYDRTNGTWHAIGTGASNGVDGPVYALLPGVDGLFIGGQFEKGGEVLAHNIVHWDGTGFATVDDGVIGRVETIVRARQGVMIGGSFRLPDEGSWSSIALWDGTTLESLDLAARAGMPGLETQYVNALLPHDSLLYIAGSFFLQEGSFWGMPNLLVYDGERVDTISSPRIGSTQSLAIGPDGELFAVGSFYDDRLPHMVALARLDSGRLTVDPGFPRRGRYGIQAMGRALCFDAAGHLVVGGSSIDTAGTGAVNDVALFDGAWKPMGEGLHFNVEVLRRVGDEVWAGGEFTMSGESASRHLARWDGSAWSEVAPVVAISGGRINDIVTLADGGVVVGGSFTSIGGVAANNVARWNGVTWEPLGLGTDRSVGACAVDAWGNVVVAAANGLTAAGRVSADGVAGWNGSEWFVPSDRFVDVQATDMAVNGETILAIGSFQISGADHQQMIAVRPGEILTPDSLLELRTASGVSPFFPLTSVAPYGDGFVVGGTFTHADGREARNIVAWSPAEGFSPLGAGFGDEGDTTVALATYGGDLFAGGNVRTAGGVGVWNIARWSEGAWSALGDGVDGRVGAIAAVAGSIYAGGDFVNAGNEPASHIARWNGAEWLPLGSGLDGGATRLVAGRDGLFVLGDFTVAGGKPADGLAQWTAPLSRVARDAPARQMEVRLEGSTLLVGREGSADAWSADLVDLRGERVATASSTAGGATRFDLSALPRGPYLLVVREEGDRSRSYGIIY